MRIVFMGTPDFAVGTLQALVESGKHEIAAVVTQPDRPKGRGQKMLMTPVKEYALSQGLPVYQRRRSKHLRLLPSCVSCGQRSSSLPLLGSCSIRSFWHCRL